MQLDTPIGDGRSRRTNRRVGWFDTATGMTHASMVLLRIENDGSQSIARDDYESPGIHGLTVEFGRRTVLGVAVTQPSETSHVLDNFTERLGFGYQGSTLSIPRVPLNRGAYYKLLVLLSGGRVGDDIQVSGDLKDGDVHRNRSATPDEKAPLFSRAARLITITLTLCVVALAVVVVARDEDPAPMGCAGGTLTLTGSTAFRPVLDEVADKYERECDDEVRIEVRTHGSAAGIRALVTAGTEAERGSPPVVALSDGPKPGGLSGLRENQVAVSVFALVVNEGVGVRTCRRRTCGGCTAARSRTGASSAARTSRSTSSAGTPTRGRDRCSSAGCWAAARSPTPRSTACTRTTRRRPSSAASWTRRNWC
ncbi:ABC-type phosphate transport system substrate-binding protein OS=Streptomyces griseomycini OX=66895 GN=FHS37_002215 PE=4 SV=1 [Streptomyces griseomycini]